MSINYRSAGVYSVSVYGRFIGLVTDLAACDPKHAGPRWQATTPYGAKLYAVNTRESAADMLKDQY